ncbi:MAG: C40 family peptidase, partial [Actinobacteria bacterium]|nr:C40 family peptidase [Actinomycetota bacterium]MBU4490293.1 C40 family peptidase [Actinomycetota bacterium]
MRLFGRLIRDQRGSVTVLMIACLFLVLVLCLLMVDIGLYLAARNRAQNAADAASIAAVQQSFPLFCTGQQPEGAASKIAGANGASLEEIEVSTGGDRVEVEVSVRPGSLLLRGVGVGPEKATARAAAEVDIDALLASNQIWYTMDPTILAGLRTFLSRGGSESFSSVSTMVSLLSIQHLGKPYVWGATGPNCFDCSGLVCYVYAQIGVRLPRVTHSQVRVGREVPARELAPGDLVFFRQNKHVGIYLGGGWYVHAPRAGDVVKISPLGARSDLSACRRVI